MALLVAYSPDVWNTEKPMDMGFVNALNQSRSFPPHDPWLAGADLNYYYLGHLAMAIFVRLTDVEPSRGYNLSIALLFALTASALFTLAGTLWAALRAALPELRRSPVVVGLVGGRRRARARQPRRRARAAPDADPPQRLRLVRALARRARDDQRVPVVLVPARRPARARAGAAVHAAGRGVLGAGRAVRAARAAAGARAAGDARRRASRSGRCTRSTRGRIR